MEYIGKKFHREILMLVACVTMLFSGTSSVNAADIATYIELKTAIQNGEAEINLLNNISDVTGDFGVLSGSGNYVKINGSNKYGINSAGYNGLTVGNNNTLELYGIGATDDWDDSIISSWTNVGGVDSSVLKIEQTGTVISENTVFTNNVSAVINEGLYTSRFGWFEQNQNVEGGAAILSENADTIIHSGVFKKNIADELHGGAIYSIDSDLKIENSIFDGNLALDKAYNPADSSTVAGDGGAIKIYSGQFNISDTQFSYNQSQFGNGGALYNDVGSGSITNAVFSNNLALNGSGGAVYNHTGSTIDKLTGEFTANRAETGGAIYNDNKILDLQGTFTGNSAGSGGAIFNDNVLYISNSEFTANATTG